MTAAIANIQPLLYARHCPKYFTDFNLFSPHNSKK